MLKFERYKNNSAIYRIKSFYYMIFRTHIRRIVVTSSAAFLLGIGISAAAVAAVNRFGIKNGAGGLETAGVPEFNESDLDCAEAAFFENAADLSKDALTDAGADNLDSAAAVLSQESGSSELELCYYTYRVKKGDMIGFIADSFNITQDTIISVNNIHQSRLLQIGQYLKIPSMPGIVYTVRTDGETPESIAERYEVSAEKCAKVNSIAVGAKLPAGSTVFVPDAQLDWVTRQEINGDLFHKPIRARYWLSSYYGWRSSPFNGKRSYHSGVDMACPSGTSVYAALGGTVTSAGFNNVYGNYVIVTHHSGYKTLYGHMSSILVTRGQYVSTNTRIGRVGSTGMSTGPHLHFTVYKFGKTVNPLGLWK